MIRPGRASGLRRAYTLVEILIVVTLLGIAGAVVVPQIGSTDVLRVQASVRTVVADINFAQSDSLARQESRALAFDVTGNKYSLIEVPGNTIEPQTNTVYVVDLNNTRRFHDSKLIEVDFDGDTTLLFDELGGPITTPGGTAPSAGGFIKVSGSGAQFEIRVEAYTGRVTVTRLP